MCLVTFSSLLLPDLRNIYKGFSSKSISVPGLILLLKLPRGAVRTSLTGLKKKGKPKSKGVPDPKLLIKLRMLKHINLFKSEVGRTSLTGLKKKRKTKSKEVPDPKLLIKLRKLKHINLFKSEVGRISLTGLKKKGKTKSTGVLDPKSLINLRKLEHINLFKSKVGRTSFTGLKRIEEHKSVTIPVPEFVLILRNIEPLKKSEVGCMVLTGLKRKGSIKSNAVPDPDLIKETSSVKGPVLYPDSVKEKHLKQVNLISGVVVRTSLTGLKRRGELKSISCQQLRPVLIV